MTMNMIAVTEMISTIATNAMVITDASLNSWPPVLSKQRCLYVIHACSIKTFIIISSAFNRATVGSSTSVVHCCYLNDIVSEWLESRYSDFCCISSWNTHNWCIFISLHSISHWVACNVSITLDTVHWLPLDSEAGEGHCRRSHRSGRGWRN